MSAMTNLLETTILNTMRNIPAPAPAAVYVALFLSDPTESGVAGTEVSYSGYARQAVTFDTPAISGTTVQMGNAAEIAFPMPTGAGGTVTHAAIMDAQTGGNVLAYRELTNPIQLTSEVSPRFAAGEIVLVMIGGNIDPTFKQKILNYLRGATIAGFNPYLALYDGDPTEEGAELAGAGYARIPLVFDTPSEQVSGQMQTENTNAAQSNSAVASWGQWVFGVVVDSDAGGNRVWYKQNLGSYNMANGAQAYVRAGDITLALN